MVIYITFFIVRVASIAHGILPNFSRGAAEGAELGNDIAEKWKSGVPRMIYMLGDIRSAGANLIRHRRNLTGEYQADDQPSRF